MRIAMLSGWHVHAEGYAKAAAAMEGVSIAAVWDELPERGRAWAERLGCPYCPRVETVLDDPTVDGVIVCAPTNRHGELLVRAARAGKHIFTEKVLALTNAEAAAVTRAVRESGVHFTISYPHEAQPELCYIRDLIRQGTLGRLTYARVRNVHSGSIKDWLPPHFYDETQCGGGAMIDLGAHPMYLLPWFLGTPKRVVSVFTQMTQRGVEDNAVSVLEFEGGAIGVSETGFVSVTDPYTVEVSGTKGCARLCGGLRYRLDGDADWTEVTQLPPPPLSPLDYWVDSIRRNSPNSLYTVEEAEALTRLMTAAYTAARQGRTAEIADAGR